MIIVFCFLDVDRPQVISSMDATKVYEGNNITLACEANNSNTVGVSYAWYRNGHVLTDQPTLNLFNVMTNHTGAYLCKVSLGLIYKVAVVEINVKCKKTFFFLSFYRFNVCIQSTSECKFD